MNQNTKNILGWAIVLAVLAVGYAALSFVYAFSHSIPASSLRSFSVTGEGKATAIPNVAEFQFTVITQGGTDLGTLQTENTAAANKAIAFVQSEGVASSDVTTEYYNVDPRYETYTCNVVVPQVYNVTTGNSAPAQSCPPSLIVGYTVTQSVDVKIRDFTKIGDVLGGVVVNGANQVGQLSFTLDDPSSVDNQAEANAITNGKAQAEAVAQAGGFTLGPLLSVQTGGNAPYPIYNSAVPMAAMAASSGASASPSIQPGSQEVDTTVTLQYEIN